MRTQAKLRRNLIAKDVYPPWRRRCVPRASLAKINGPSISVAKAVRRRSMRTKKIKFLTPTMSASGDRRKYGNLAFSEALLTT
jgi:hypothetical protein